MGASIFRTSLTVVPICVLAWLYVLARFPSEYIIPLIALIGLMMIGLVGIGVWREERRRLDLDDLASWAERIATGRETEEPAMVSIEPYGDQIIQSVRRLVRKHRRQAKKRSRELDRLLTILAYMHDGVVILNKSGRIRMMNTSACEFFDTSFDEARGRTFIQVVRDHRIAEIWQIAKDSGEQTKRTLEFGERLFRVIATPFLHGNARGFLIILQDLTELNRLQTVRQNFVTNISHELRTPLASLRALAETLSDSALDDPPAARRFLGRMEIEVDALTGLVNDLFELSRIESGQIGLAIEPTPPQAFVSNSVERLTPHASRAEVDVMMDIPDSLPLVRVDQERIEQVMMNLIHNAIKFTPPQGTINVSAEHVNGSVNVLVRDTGMGIAEEHLPHIFERFYKADESRHGAGSGLGLAIAKHIIQAHDGNIWADSVEGRGSTFSFSLPAITQN